MSFKLPSFNRDYNLETSNIDFEHREIYFKRDYAHRKERMHAQFQQVILWSIYEPSYAMKNYLLVNKNFPLVIYYIYSYVYMTTLTFILNIKRHHLNSSSAYIDDLSLDWFSLYY